MRGRLTYFGLRWFNGLDTTNCDDDARKATKMTKGPNDGCMIANRGFKTRIDYEASNTGNEMKKRK